MRTFITKQDLFVRTQYGTMNAERGHEWLLEEEDMLTATLVDINNNRLYIEKDELEFYFFEV